uniref:Uncharacterized protein n=1 Tax=Cucumis melo TaxID=3656 RepID=A0A9I9EKT8_CUCME
PTPPSTSLTPCDSTDDDCTSTQPSNRLASLPRVIGAPWLADARSTTVGHTSNRTTATPCVAKLKWKKRITPGDRVTDRECLYFVLNYTKPMLMRHLRLSGDSGAKRGRDRRSENLSLGFCKALSTLPQHSYLPMSVQQHSSLR